MSCFWKEHRKAGLPAQRLWRLRDRENRTRTGGRNSRRGREVSGSAGRGDYISHKPAGWAGGRRGAGVGDLTDRLCPRRIKVKAGAAAPGEE